MLCSSREHCGHRIIGVTSLFNVRMCPLAVKQFPKSPVADEGMCSSRVGSNGSTAAFLSELPVCSLLPLSAEPREPPDSHFFREQMYVIIHIIIEYWYCEYSLWSLKSVKINRKARSCRYYLVLKVSSSSCVTVFVDDVLVTRWGAQWNSVAHYGQLPWKRPSLAWPPLMSYSRLRLLHTYLCFAFFLGGGALNK